MEYGVHASDASEFIGKRLQLLSLSAAAAGRTYSGENGVPCDGVGVRREI